MKKHGKFLKALCFIIFIIFGRIGNCQNISIPAFTGTTFCAGTNLKISFTITGTFLPGNIFKAELSDANGNFSTPATIIGTFSATSIGTSNAPINAVIPANSAYGTGYLIKITGSNPVIPGTPSSAFTINPIPDAKVTASQKICAGTVITIGDVAVGGNTYTWTSTPPGFNSASSNPSVPSTTSTTTVYALTETITATGCNKKSNVTITINPNNNTISTKSISKGSSIKIGETAVENHNYSWVSNPPGFSATKADTTVSPSVTTLYTLTETIAGTTCSMTDIIAVTVSNIVTPTAGKFLLAKKIPVYEKSNTPASFWVEADTSQLTINNNFLSIALMGNIIDKANNSVSSEKVKFPITNILKKSCYLDDLVRGYVPGTRKVADGPSKFEALQFRVEDKQFFIFYKDIISYQPDLTNAKYGLDIVDTFIRIVPNKPVAVFEAKPTVTNISFVGTGNLQQSIGFGDNGQIPATAGLGVTFERNYHNQPSVFFPHRWPRLARLEGQVSVNVASSLDTIVVKETGDYLSRNSFGAFLLSPISSGKSATGSLRIYFTQRPYHEITNPFLGPFTTTNGCDFEFTVSSRNWTYSDPGDSILNYLKTKDSITIRPKIKPFTIEATALAWKIGVFHEFFPEDLENYSFSIGLAYIDRFLVGNINQSNSGFKINPKLPQYNTTNTADSIRYVMLYGPPNSYQFNNTHPFTNGNFGGWELYIRLKLVNLKADVELTNLYTDPVFFESYIGHIVADKHPVAGLSDAQFIVRLSYVGGFSLQLHPNKIQATASKPSN